MKRPFLYFLLSLCTIQVLFAQEPTIRWSEPFRYKKKERPIKLLHQEGEEVYLLYGKLKSSFKHYFIKVFRKGTLTALRSVSLIQVLPQSADLSLDRVTVYNGVAYFFLRDRRYLYCSKYNFASQTATLDAKRITLAPEPINPYSKSDTHSSVFFSEEGEHIVAYYNMPNDKNWPEKIRYTLLDTSLQQVDQRFLHLPYKDKHFQDDKYWVNTRGDLSLLGFGRTENKGIFAPILYRYTRQSEEAYEVNFPLPRGYLLNFHLKCQKGELQYQGLRLADDHIFFYLFRYNEERNKLTSTLSIDLTHPDLVAQNPFVYENDLDLKQFDLLEVKHLTDDTLLFVLEQQVFTIQEPKSYYFDDMLVCKATNKGEVLWITKIPKRQALIRSYVSKGLQSQEAISEGADLLSVSMLATKAKVYLLYSDHEENFTAHQPQDLHTLRFKQESAIYLAQVNYQGQWERRLLDPSLHAYYLSQTAEYTISDKELMTLAFSSRRKEFKLLWVRVE